jgi:hypothetical protein
MPSTFYVPILIVGMILTVCVPPYLLCPPAHPTPPGIMQLTMVQVSGMSPDTYSSPLLYPFLDVLRTCNASRTVMTPIRHSMSCMNNQCGRHFRCSVRLISFVCFHLLVNSPRRHSGGNALYVCCVHNASLPLALMLCLGFLPVAYAWLVSKRSSVRLPLDETSEPATLASQPHGEDEAEAQRSSGHSKPLTEPLTGYRVLLLWLPALCDLTGTTVRFIHNLPTPLARCFSLHDRSSILFASFPIHLSASHVVSHA